MIECIQLAERDNRQSTRRDEWDCLMRGDIVGKIMRDPENTGHAEEFLALVREDDSRYHEGYRMAHVGYAPTLYGAKVLLQKYLDKYPGVIANSQSRRAQTAYLPAWDNEFYPTPSNVAGHLLAGVQWRNVKTVLEPSAGKGDLIDHARRCLKTWVYRKTHYYYDTRAENLDVDCVEIDPDLQAFLVGKKLRVVHDDFLSYNTRKRYDLILMNPPFSEGDLHLLHALEMCENGGQIACVLNAETIRNPYTNTRRLLLKKLTAAGASIRYLNNAFAKAQRKANVDVALINVNIPKKFIDEGMWDDLKKAHNQTFGSEEAPNEIAPSDNVDRLIREHDLMCDAGISLMRTFNGIAPHIRRGTERYEGPMIYLSVGDHDCKDGCDTEDVNRFLRMVRGKYWNDLFRLPELTSKMTAEMRKHYDGLIQEMRDYEFSKFNIQQVIAKIMGQLQSGVEEAIAKCFATLTDKYTFDDNLKNGNIHYFNGWKTNKAHYVGMRCIIPTWDCFATEYRKTSHGGYKDVKTDAIKPNACFSILDDLEKAFDYLDKGETLPTDLMNALQCAAKNEISKKIECKYFYVTFYKRGTCHIQFKDKKIVDRLNIFIGRTKAWLPPTYGKVHYEEMDDESRRVVDEFQGREAYETVMQNRDDYLIEAKAPLMLSE